MLNACQQQKPRASLRPFRFQPANMVTARSVIPRSMLHSLYRVLPLLAIPKSKSELIIALDQGIDHAFSVLLVCHMELRSLWSTGKLHVVIAKKFSSIPVKYVKTTSSCSTKRVHFWRNFCDEPSKLPNITPRSFRLTPLKIVVRFVLRPNSTTCPNAAQNTPLRNFKKMQNVNPPTHQPPALYLPTDPNTYLTRAMHHKGAR